MRVVLRPRVLIVLWGAREVRGALLIRALIRQSARRADGMEVAAGGHTSPAS